MVVCLVYSKGIMNTQSQVTESSPAKFRLVNPGTMGEEKVLRSLLGDGILYTRETIEGYAVYKQDKPPSFVWDDIGMKKFWDEKEGGGPHYGGAFTLVPEKGATAVVGVLEFPTLHGLREIADKLNFWSFHGP